MGGILEVAGLTRFLDPDALDSFRRSVTGQRASEWELFFQEWGHVIGSQAITASDVIAKLATVPAAVIVQSDPAKSLGRYLSQRVNDVVVRDLVLRSAGRRLWALLPLHATANAPKVEQTTCKNLKTTSTLGVCDVWTEGDPQRADPPLATHEDPPRRGDTHAPNGANGTDWKPVVDASIAADPTSPLARLVRRGRSKK